MIPLNELRAAVAEALTATRLAFKTHKWYSKSEFKDGIIYER